MDLNNFISFKNKWPSVMFDAFVLSTIGIILLFLYESVKYLLPYFLFIYNAPDSIKILFFLLYLYIFFLIFKNVSKWIQQSGKRLILWSKGGTYKFDGVDWPNKWIFNGQPDIVTTNDTELKIQSCRAGCLLSSHCWKDLNMSFEMRFVTEHETLGIVFRGEDLDNYFMLQLSRKHNQITPHIKFRGGWDICLPMKTNVFDAKKSFKIGLKIKNVNLQLRIDKNLVFSWILPTHVDVNYFEPGVPQQEAVKSKQSAENFIQDLGHVQEIPFRLNFGMIGFRASPGEGALIKNLVVESI